MTSDKVFQITLVVSALTHGIILLQHANLNLFPRDKNKEKPVLRYIKDAGAVLDYQKLIPKTTTRQIKIPPRISADELPPPPFAEQENIFNKDKAGSLSGPSLKKPIHIRPDIIAVKKKITLPPIDINKINNPSYINYYQIVREKIRRSAYQNYTRTETGEVYLSFIIANDGSLGNLNLWENKSSASAYLKEVALRSVRESSPFPKFPLALSYPHLSFNVVISFETD